MVTISIADGNLVVDVQGSHKFFAMKSQITVPLEHVESARHDPEYANRWWHGVKMVGSEFFNVFAAGTFWSTDGFRFWDVRHPENAIVIDLKDEKLAEIVVEVEEPFETIQLIEKALRRNGDG